MKLKFCIYGLCLLQGLNAFAQDIHFSQFYMSPLSLNPASTGSFNGDYRFAGNYRGQWAAVPVPYTTFSGSADMNVLGSRLGSDKLGAGVFLYNDVAGDADFGTTQAAVSASFIKTLGEQRHHAIAVGLQPGIVQRTINFSKLRFDNQYNGDVYDPAASTGETFANSNFTYFNFATGVTWLYRPGERTSYSAGAAVFNINNPGQSFFDNTDVRLAKRAIFHGRAQFEISQKLDLIPALMFLKQQQYKELTGGASLKYYLDKLQGCSQALYGGLWYRNADAIILSTGYDYQDFNFGLSYDINISNLRPASDGRGGLEIAVIYIIRKVPPLVNKKICPAYL